jgi:transcriptional regulator with XRE-family HTH domain
MDETDFYRQFGNLLRERRRKLGLTQESLAEDVGLSRTSITNIERGEQRVLLHQLYSLAEKLRVSPKRLLPDVSSRPAQFERQLEALPPQKRALILKIVRSQNLKRK